jgi:hypothetical protein
MVIVVVADAAVGVTEPDEKEQVTPDGSPEQVKFTVLLNPPRAVRVMTSVPLDPRATLSVGVAAAIWKSVLVRLKLTVAVAFVALAVTL